MKAPARDRPKMPEGYIAAGSKGMLPWSAAERLLTTAPYVWLATTGADGGPHLVQQWAVWIDQHLYFDGSERTRWARNLARDPRLSFGAQQGHRAIYGDGRVELVRAVTPALARRIARQFSAKYGSGFKYRPKAAQYENGYVYKVSPEKLIAFDVKKFNTSATRFRFSPTP